MRHSACSERNEQQTATSGRNMKKQSLDPFTGPKTGRPILRSRGPGLGYRPGHGQDAEYEYNRVLGVGAGDIVGCSPHHIKESPDDQGRILIEPLVAQKRAAMISVPSITLARNAAAAGVRRHSFLLSSPEMISPPTCRSGRSSRKPFLPASSCRSKLYPKCGSADVPVFGAVRKCRCIRPGRRHRHERRIDHQGQDDDARARVVRTDQPPPRPTLSPPAGSRVSPSRAACSSAPARWSRSVYRCRTAFPCRKRRRVCRLPPPRPYLRAR